jgi:hypothetical protein
MSAGTDPSFPQALAESLLAHAVPDLTADEARAGARFTAERLSGAPAFTRIGMTAIGTLLDGQVRAARRRPFAALDAAERAAWVARWSARPLPGITDYLDAVRGLALTWLYEERAA